MVFKVGKKLFGLQFKEMGEGGGVFMVKMRTKFWINAIDKEGGIEEIG